MKNLTVFRNAENGRITGAVLEYNNKFISFDEEEANELTVTDYMEIEKNVAVGNLKIPVNRIQTIVESDE